MDRRRELKKNAVVGRWVVDGPPLKGGNARVYPVRHPRDPVRRALKLLYKNTDEAVGRFRREITALRKLSTHPNLVGLVDSAD